MARSLQEAPELRYQCAQRGVTDESVYKVEEQTGENGERALVRVLGEIPA